jgi:hypothetical protein
MLASMASRAAHADAIFAPDERAALVTYWNADGRYGSRLPDAAAADGPWQVRLTPAGSGWLLRYQNAIGAAAPPTQSPDAVTSPVPGWQAWVRAKLARDRWQAQLAADAANAAVHPSPAATLATPPAAPQVPGPIPADLLAAAGDPPPLAGIVAPMLWTVTFDDSESFGYQDNVQLQPAFAYYRFPEGTVAHGPALRDLPAAELDALFAASGMTETQQHVARAVSRLEGGFESVNTYDTGFVSVGFIQFASMGDGKHSLSEVMLREKADRPADFSADFHRYGLDVGADGAMVAVDPATGAELAGGDAVLKVIADKRLAAVFQRAGRHSRAFRTAQIRIAASHYWPADDAFTVTENGQPLSGKVSDIIHSEAGLATLFDRKINRGSIAPFTAVLTRVMAAHNLSSLADAVPYEREIITGMKYRADFLAETSLTQPPP